MSKLHFYVDGTPGGTDGTEVTQLTFKNLKKFFSYSAYSSNSRFLIFYARFEPGYKGNITLHSLIGTSLYIGEFGTSFPDSFIPLNHYDVNANVTDVNYGICLEYILPTDNDNGVAHTDVPLQDFISVGFMEKLHK